MDSKGMAFANGRPFCMVGVVAAIEISTTLWIGSLGIASFLVSSFAIAWGASE